MAKQSAGILMYRRHNDRVEVFLVHPGGPFWAKKDVGAWSIPKGEISREEEPLETAKREFREETGIAVNGEFVPLPPVKQPGGKVVHAWLLEGDCDADDIQSNTFTMQWPPRSGQTREFPEVDRAGWFSLSAAKEKMLKGQRPLLDEITAVLSDSGNEGSDSS